MGYKVLHTIKQDKKSGWGVKIILTGFLVLLSQFVIQFTIHLESADSTVINIAGRQRMLSQRINKCAFGFNQAKDESERAHYLDELKISVALWERSQNGLLYGDKELGLPGRQYL